MKTENTNIEETIKQNLNVGDEIKYIELCERLNIPYLGGYQKKAQLESLSQYFKFTKNGVLYHIDEIYEIPIIKYKPAPVNYINLEQFLPSVQDGRQRGVYIIQQDNNVYIGSTIINFRQRFYQHYKKYKNQIYGMNTYNMLHNGGTFDILWFADDNATEKEIRKKEEYFIQLYLNNPEYNLVNTKMDAYLYKELNKKSKPIKYTKIKINQDDRDKIEKLLAENNIKYKVMKK